MSDVTFIACESCQAEGEVMLPAPGDPGPLLCLHCHSLIGIISVVPWRAALEDRVREFAHRQSTGEIGSRKQSFRQSDTAIDRDGLEAELAACLLLCPGYRHQWLAAQGPNRGADLSAAWTMLPQAVEVKQTRYCDPRRGYLLVRPPRWTPGPMRAEYIDDCLYMLMHGQHGLYTLLGWADRSLLLAAGRLNPVPVLPGQRECWGIHWGQLRPLQSLRAMFGQQSPPRPDCPIAPSSAGQSNTASRTRAMPPPSWVQSKMDWIRA